jgi:hypothetical protein
MERRDGLKFICSIEEWSLVERLEDEFDDQIYTTRILFDYIVRVVYRVKLKYIASGDYCLLNFHISV